MENMLMGILAPVAVTVAGTVVTWGLAEVARFMRARVRNEETREALSRVMEAAQSVVAELEVSMRRELAGTGKLSPAQAVALKRRAVNLVESQLDPGTRGTLTTAVNGMLEEYLSGVVERALLWHKQDRVLPPAVDLMTN